jgi:hypothetical protein
MTRNAALICCALLLLTVAAFAASVSHGGSLPLTQTNWINSITVPKFDPSLGTLTGITFSLAGQVQGLAQFESLDAGPATVTMDLSAALRLQRPDGSDLVVTIPVAHTSDDVTAFDQVMDFGGTSGRTYPSLSASKTETAVSPPPLSDLTLFTAGFAGETITLPVRATGNSEAAGAGNILVVFQTSASADATVTYEYDAVPEPSSFLALLAGIGGLAGLSARKRLR